MPMYRCSGTTIYSMEAHFPQPAENASHRMECRVTDGEKGPFVHLRLVDMGSEQLRQRVQNILTQLGVSEDARAAGAQLLENALCGQAGAEDDGGEEDLLIDTLLHGGFSSRLAELILDILLEHELQPGFYTHTDGDGTPLTVSYSKSAVRPARTQQIQKNGQAWSASA